MRKQMPHQVTAPAMAVTARAMAVAPAVMELMVAVPFSPSLATVLVAATVVMFMGAMVAMARPRSKVKGWMVWFAWQAAENMFLAYLLALFRYGPYSTGGLRPTCKRHANLPRWLVSRSLRVRVNAEEHQGLPGRPPVTVTEGDQPSSQVDSLCRMELGMWKQRKIGCGLSVLSVAAKLWLLIVLASRP